MPDELNLGPAIPVLYYHGVGDHPKPRPKSFLTLPAALFRRQLEAISGWRLRTVFLDEVTDHVRGRSREGGRRIALTFDDGFLDNWVHVFPLAKRLDIRFTIYVNPDFVDPRDIVRPTLEDVWSGRVCQDELEWWGFLSWPEMKRMEESGLVDIQSHGKTHTWYPCGPKVVDYHRPGSPHYWVTWNARPESKPFWMSRYNETVVHFGTPIFEHGKSLAIRRFFPDERLSAHLGDYVRERGGAGFFGKEGWRAALDDQTGDWTRRNGPPGRFETDSEQAERFRDELAGSRSIIGQQLGKTVNYFCWPGGGVSRLARELARAAGYVATTKGSLPNGPGGDPTSHFRVSGGLPARLPEALSWWLWQGQIERASGSQSLRSRIVGLLSRANRAVV